MLPHPEAIVVTADFSKSACRKIRKKLKFLPLEVLDGGINDFIEIVWQVSWMTSPTAIPFSSQGQQAGEILQGV